MLFRIREIRTQHGLTQKKQAALLGIPYSTYRKYESGQVVPPISVLVRVADLYHISTDYLMGRTDDPIPYPK